MTNLNFERKGKGSPTIVMVHGFACRLSDWAAQVAHLSPRFETIALDLPGHGKTAGTTEDARIEVLARNVADLLEDLDISNAVLVGHSMGCRVIVEAAGLVPKRVAGLILVDGSRLGTPGSGAGAALAKSFAEGHYPTFVSGFFKQMFLADSAPKLVSEIVDNATALPQSFGSKLLPDIGRWDEMRFDEAFRCVHVPMLIIQSTYTNPERKRSPMTKGQNTPYFDFVCAAVPGVRIEIVEKVGHFPQIERAAEVNAAMDGFLASLPKV